MKKMLVLAAAAVTVTLGLGMTDARAEHNWGLNDEYQHGAPTIPAMGGKAGPGGGNIGLNDDYLPGPKLTPVMSSKAGPMIPTGRDDHHVDAADHYRQLGVQAPKG